MNVQIIVIVTLRSKIMLTRVLESIDIQIDCVWVQIKATHVMSLLTVQVSYKILSKINNVKSRNVLENPIVTPV